MCGHRDVRVDPTECPGEKFYNDYVKTHSHFGVREMQSMSNAKQSINERLISFSDVLGNNESYLAGDSTSAVWGAKK